MCSNIATRIIRSYRMVNCFEASVIPSGLFINTHFRNYAVNSTSTSPLANLRKDTGFPISHCKKALELHYNDIEKAKEWLLEEAQSHGWTKATKLSGRNTSQGLIGVYVKNNIGTLVEVNCETDFVARNKDFQTLVANITKSCAFTIPSTTKKDLTECFDSSQLSSLTTEDGTSFGDMVALAIGKIGENISLRRAIVTTCDADQQLKGYAHPTNLVDSVLLGKFATLVTFKNLENNDDVAKDICVHIIGMNPKNVGSLEDLPEREIVTENVTPEDTEETKMEETSNDNQEETPDDYHEEAPSLKAEKVEESVLILQNFLNDPEVRVGDVLKEKQMDILNFVRLQVGQSH